MKPEAFSINKPVAKLMVLGAALVSLQPGLLEIVLPVMAVTVSWLLLAGKICIRRLVVLLGGLGLAAIGLQMMIGFYEFDGSKKHFEDLELPYPDLSKYKIYNQ